MGKFWSIVFLLIPVLGVGAFVVSPIYGVWLPLDVSADGHVIDHLFMFILFLTGAVFIATELVLVWYLWRYDGATNASPVKYTHGSHNLEIIWTIIPAATLLFIAIYQINAWADVKMRPPRAVESGIVLEMVGEQLIVKSVATDSPAYRADMHPGERILSVAGREVAGMKLEEAAALLVAKPAPDKPPVVLPISVVTPSGLTIHRRVELVKRPLAEVTGRQFEWRIRYPGPDGKLHTMDDLLDVNDLHVPVDEDILLVIKSDDVLHSFFLPNLRLKQDVVPGKRQMQWFKATQTGQFDIVCAELCGWGHYKMKGRITIESRADYERWLNELAERNHATTETVPESDEDE